MLNIRSSLHAFTLATVTLSSMALGSAAHAYKDGTYNCKHGDAKMPANVYKISTIDVPAAGGNVPFLDIVSYYREDATDANSPIYESHLKGFATAWSDNGDHDALLLATIRLDFNKNKMLNCAQ